MASQFFIKILANFHEGPDKVIIDLDSDNIVINDVKLYLYLLFFLIKFTKKI